VTAQVADGILSPVFRFPLNLFLLPEGILTEYLMPRHRQSRHTSACVQVMCFQRITGGELCVHKRLTAEQREYAAMHVRANITLYQGVF
jgi:hypothetical protein